MGERRDDPLRSAAFALGVLACASGFWAERTRSPAALSEAARSALSRGDAEAALGLARAAAAADPGDAAIQAQRAHAAALASEGPGREAISALTESYRAAPYPPAAEMVWRVDFAEALWPSIPDPLAAATLTQIEALGAMPDQWPTRVRWCRSARAEPIAKAACATVPGVERGLDLKTRAAPADPR